MPLFWNDLEKVYDGQYALEQCPLILSEITLIHVLAGRGSALKKPVDSPTVLDPEDDHARMQYAIKMAYKIKRLTGAWTPIYYSGREQHIADLKTALAHGDVFDYPKAFLIICPIPCQRTFEQVQAFKQFIAVYPEDITIAVVSSAFHLPRAARTFGGMVSQNLLFFGIDREKKRPGVEKDIACELDALKNYSKGDPPKISRFQPDHTFLNITDVFFKQSMVFQKKEARLFQPPKIHISDPLELLY